MFEAKWGIRLVRELSCLECALIIKWCHRIPMSNLNLIHFSNDALHSKYLVLWLYCGQFVVYTDDFTHCKMFWIIIQSKHCTYHSGMKSVKTLCHSKHAIHLFFFYFSSNIKFCLLLAVLYIIYESFTMR